MNTADGTRNIMYFAFNLNRKILEKAVAETAVAEHLMRKFDYIVGKHNQRTTPAFFDWFMELSTGNQRIIVNNINALYTGI